MRYAAVALPAFLGAIGSASSQVIINEVADRGSSGACDGTGSDWLELHLPLGNGTAAASVSTRSSSVDLSGYVLHDEKGPSDDDAYTFPAGSSIGPGEFLLLCLGNEGDPSSPQFGVGKTDEVSLLDASGAVISMTGPLGGRGEVDVAFAYDPATSAYVYTSTPTPGEANLITLIPEPETVEEMRARLTAQDERGRAFFNMDGSGLEVEDAFDPVVDLRMTIDPATWQQMYEDRSYEIYSPFESVVVTALDDPATVLANLTSPGRIRPKGQSTLSFGICLDRSIPYKIEFDHTDSDQTLFGVQQGYLRSHFSDGSHAREWVAHRMLARFGLPHLRTRTVRFHVNDEYVGLYSFMEAVDQDYVFQRSFPDHDPKTSGLYKVKTLSVGCGMYSDDKLQLAEALVDTEEKPPYSFERGEHRTKQPVLGPLEWEQCMASFFFGVIGAEEADVVLAYLRADKDCAKMLLAEGLIDRDMGSRALDSDMEAFIANNLAGNTCDAGCANSNLADDVDTSQFLRNLAVMAALLHQDSPLGNGNNYYLASTGDGSGWKMVQYDHNNVISDLTDGLCEMGKCIDHLMKWSIDRPTCHAFEAHQIAGPLLSNEELHQEYLGYVKEFVTDVMGNKDMLDQIKNHLEVLKDHVGDDPWNDTAALFSYELSDDDTWFYNLGELLNYMPLLPALRARSAEIMKQLDALENGTFPRDLSDIQAHEVCVDWESTGPEESACPAGCRYDGCMGGMLDLPPVCDEATGICYISVPDEKCEGVAMGMQYEGMEPLNDEKPSFCMNDASSFFLNIKVSECPSYKGNDETGDAVNLQDNDDTSDSKCPAGCRYDGCFGGILDLEPACNELDGLCYVGVPDPKCEGVAPGMQYEGMEPLNSEKPPFCWNDASTLFQDTRASECPSYNGNDITSDAENLQGIDDTSDAVNLEGDDSTSDAGDLQGSDGTSDAGDLQGSDSTSDAGDLQGKNDTSIAGDLQGKGDTSDAGSLHMIATPWAITSFVVASLVSLL